MNKKTIITIIIILLLLIAGGGVIYWYWQSQQNNNSITDSSVDVVTDGSTSGVGLPALDQPLVDDKTEVDSPAVSVDTSLTTNVYYFVERFGTYSNVSDFQNIDDLKSVMSNDFYNQVIAKRKNLSFADTSSIEYEAYDAKVVRLEWLDNTDIRATAKVTTRRHKITKDSNEPYSQDIIVRLDKVNNQWLVTEAVWQ